MEPESVTKNKKHSATRKSQLKKAGKIILAVFAVALFIGWWHVLRIEEHDNWPPPADAITSEQSLPMTERFLSREDARRDDVAIAYAPSTASDAELFLDGTSYFEPQLADIAAAEQSVHIIMFGFTPGTWGDRFADTLIAKAGEGVPVRLIVDSQGSKATSNNQWFFDRMAAGGVQIVVNDTVPLQTVGEVPDTDFTWRQDEVGRAEHRKMFVVDGRIAWVGGAGFEDHYYNGGWIDTYVRVEGDIVRQLQAVFCTSFHAYGGSLPSELSEYFPEPGEAGDVRVTLLQNIPGGFVPGTQATQEALDNADERLDILNPYFTDAGIMDKVVDASERGTDVRIVTGRDSNNVPGQYALMSQYERLIDAGVEVYEVPGIVHSKVTVADDTFIIGSINYDAWALYRNLELSLMFEDAELADAAVLQLVEPVVAQGELAEPPEGWREKIPADFWWLFRYLL